jgi:hypothetical protein
MKTAMPFALALVTVCAFVACSRTRESTDVALRDALIHHASFDHSTQADYSVGDGTLVHEARDENTEGKHYVIRSSGYPKRRSSVTLA